MTKRQFVVLVFRLFALYLLLNLLTSLGLFIDSISMAGNGMGFQGIFVGAFSIFVALWLISLVWKKSEWLMQKVFTIPALSDTPTLRASGEQEERTIPEIPLSEEPEFALESGTLESQDYYETPLSIESIQLLSISIVGLWAAIAKLPELLQRIGIILTASGPLFSGTRYWPYVVADLITVGLGLWLFLRPWQFQEWIERFKPKAASSDERSD